ncbi:hypothetical protein KAH81_07000 [bacterium]|nr:hypothetical protein [bacterium]
MKRIVIFLAILAFAVSGLAVWVDSAPDSGHIGVGAGMDGQFSIGVPPNPPDFPGVRELLHSSYRHSSPDGAYFGIWVDSSVIYSNGPIISTLYPDSASYLDDFQILPSTYDPINFWIKTEWLLITDPFGNDSIRISQILQPIETGGSGTVVVKWIIQNQSSVSHDIGLMLFFDTKIGRSDTARIVAPGIPLSDSCRVLPDVGHGWELPPYWQAFEGDPTDTTDDALVTKAVLSLPPNTTPDRIAFGDIHDFLGIYWAPTITMNEYFDSAVLSWWYPVTTPPGSTIIIQTSYGLADSTASVAGIYGMNVSYSHNLIATNCQLVPNPFSLTVGVTNNSDSTVSDMRVSLDLTSADYCTLGVAETTVKSTVPSTLAEGEMGFAFWNIAVNNPPLDDSLDSLRFEAFTTDSSTISPPFTVWLEGSDYIGPIVETIEPLWGTITSDPNQVIKMYIHDEDSYVDSTRIFFGFITAAGTLYVGIDYPELSFHDDTLYFDPPEALQNARYYWFHLAEAEDIDGCPSASDSGRFLCDLVGPTIGPNHFPPDSSIQTDSLLDVWINCKDALGSIRLSSIHWRFSLDGFLMPINVIGGVPGEGVGINVSSEVMEPDTAYWNPGSWTSGLSHIPDGWVTSTLAGLTDDPDYGIPNPCPGVPFGWTWIMNSHGPRAHPILPYDGDFVSVPDTDIVYYLYDGNSMITDSSRIMLDGGIIDHDGGPRDSIHTIVVDPSTAFPNGYLVEVEVVNAYDSLFTTLDMTSHRAWSYTIDTAPPIIVNGSIGDGDTIGLDHLDVTIAVTDSIAGVNPESLTVFVNGVPVTASYSADLVEFTLDVDTDSAVIAIQVCDNIDVGPANWLDEEITVYIVMEGPRVHFAGYEDGYICCATGPIIWSIIDPDGVDESTIVVEVNGDTMTIADSRLSFNPTVSELTYTPSSAWTDGFYVSAQLITVEDIYGFCLASPVSGSWIVDLDPPVWSHTVAGTLFIPSSGYYNDSLIIIDWTWDEGEFDSISLVVGGSTFDETTPGFTITDSVFTFDSPVAEFVLDSAETYYFILQAKEVCAFSEGEWITDTFEIYSTEIDELKKLPMRVELYPNRPDPFNATTTVPFELAKYGKVTIEISDILGRRVCTLYSGILDAGYYEKVWNGKDDSGRDAPSGVYNCRLICGREIHTQKITLLR